MFLSLALPLSLGLMSLPAMAQYDVIPGRSLPGKVGLGMEEAASVLLILSIFPMALLVTALEGGRPAVRILLRRVTRWRVAARWWLFAVLAFPLSTITLAIAFGDQAQIPSAGTLLSESVSMLIALLCINVWEEGTWAGFMQTRLERRHSFLLAAGLTSLPFALVHMPLRVITGEVTSVGELLVAFIILAIFVVFVRTILGTVVRGAANSVLLAAVTHTLFNRSNNVDGVAADVLIGDNRQNAALLATVMLAVGIAIVNRKKLTRGYRERLDARETFVASSIRSMRECGMS